MKKQLFAFLLLAIAWVVSAVPAFATACTAGCVQFGTVSAFSGTTLTLTLGSALGAGHDLRMFWVTDSITNFATGVTVGGTSGTVGSNHGTGGGKASGTANYPNTPASSPSIVLTVGATCGNCFLVVEEWAGDATTTPVDGQNATYTADVTSGTSLPCGSITTTGSNDTIEAFMYQPQNVASTVPSGYTTANDNHATAWQTASLTGQAAGAQNPTWLSGTGGTDNFSVCSGFLNASGGGGGKVLLLKH